VSEEGKASRRCERKEGGVGTRRADWPAGQLLSEATQDKTGPRQCGATERAVRAAVKVKVGWEGPVRSEQGRDERQYWQTAHARYREATGREICAGRSGRSVQKGELGRCRCFIMEPCCVPSRRYLDSC
jgi:lipase chaperone LimK